MNILDFGAKRGAFCGDAIQRAIDAAAAQGGGRVNVPAGEYETASLILRSNVELHLEAGAVLRFVDDFDAYPVVNIRWEGYEQPCHRPLEMCIRDRLSAVAAAWIYTKPTAQKMA